MNAHAFHEWFNTVRCTKPFTVDDARELHRLIHERLVPENVKVDVYTAGGEVVIVRIETPAQIFVRHINVS